MHVKLQLVDRERLSSGELNKAPKRIGKRPVRMLSKVKLCGIVRVSRGLAVAGSHGRSFKTEATPSPPKLPKEEQEEFERLQRIAQSQEAIDAYNREIEGDSTKESLNSPLLTRNDIGSFSPEFSKTLPEFEGDKNPETGEIGGPKQDPLRHGDYSFNGRVTDF